MARQDERVVAGRDGPARFAPSAAGEELLSHPPLLQALLLFFLLLLLLTVPPLARQLVVQKRPSSCIEQNGSQIERKLPFKPPLPLPTVQGASSRSELKPLTLLPPSTPQNLILGGLEHTGSSTRAMLYRVSILSTVLAATGVVCPVGAHTAPQHVSE